MRLTSLSLYAAIWHISTTFALVARPSNLQVRADTTLKFPKGYNAQTCPLDRSNVVLTASPAKSKAFPPPASAPAAPKAAMTRRVPPQAYPIPVCQTVCNIAFTGVDYEYSFDGLSLDVMTYMFVLPGEYAFIVNGNGFIRGLSLAQHYPDADLLPVRIDHIIDNNPTNFLSVDFRLDRPTRLCFRITFYGPNVAGEIGLFTIVPSAGRQASERAGLYGPSLLQR